MDTGESNKDLMPLYIARCAQCGARIEGVEPVQAGCVYLGQKDDRGGSRPVYDCIIACSLACLAAYQAANKLYE